eukprot:8358271-Pyramimonas_sp.AAC.1
MTALHEACPNHDTALDIVLVASLLLSYLLVFLLWPLGGILACLQAISGRLEASWAKCWGLLGASCGFTGDFLEAFEAGGVRQRSDDVTDGLPERSVGLSESTHCS